MNTLAYKTHVDDVIKGLQLLVERKAQDRIFASFTLPSMAMIEFRKHYSGNIIHEYPDPHVRMKFWDSFLQERSLVEDDGIPAAYPSEFDQGLYGGILGGDVRFLSMIDDGYVSSGWISSMVPPLLKDWSEFSALRFDESHIWFQRYIEQLKLMTETARGKFGISHLILIDSLNFIFELVGATNTYWSLIDCPEMAHKAIDFAFDLNLKIQKTFFDIVGTLEGGTCSWVLPWIPGRILNESVDPFHMMSVNDFEKWGREPIERILQQYDGGVLHNHANGRHLLEVVYSIKGLKAMLLVDEKAYPPAFDILDELKARAGDMPISVMANYNDFVEKLTRHTLTGGVFYYVSGAQDVNDVNRCMEKVRKYRV